MSTANFKLTRIFKIVVPVPKCQKLMLRTLYFSKGWPTFIKSSWQVVCCFVCCVSTLTQFAWLLFKWSSTYIGLYIFWMITNYITPLYNKKLHFLAKNCWLKVKWVRACKWNGWLCWVRLDLPGKVASTRLQLTHIQLRQVEFVTCLLWRDWINLCHLTEKYYNRQ